MRTGLPGRLPADRIAAKPRTYGEMNVTPLIDILLVLLIIFMAALPMTQQGIEVELPVTEPAASAPAPSGHIVLEYTADRRLSVNTVPVALSELEPRLRDIFSPRRDRTLLVRGAGSLRYGDIVGVIDAARGAGVTRVGVITDGMAEAAAR